jgi:competence protein ComFB
MEGQMSYRNLMEDITRTAVEEVLKKDNEVSQINSNADDIAAYVLNRVPPRYVTSERGILHGKLQARLATQQKTDIFMLIYEAIEVIKKRRNNETKPGHTKFNDLSLKGFPHIIGQVLEETTFSIIPDVEITLFNGKNRCGMVDTDWKNPYKTNKSTMGYYHFWPAYDEKTMGEGSVFKFRLEYRHKLLGDKDFEFQLDYDSPTGIGMSYIIPIVLLQPKPGIPLKDVCGDCAE